MSASPPRSLLLGLCALLTVLGCDSPDDAPLKKSVPSKEDGPAATSATEAVAETPQPQSRLTISAADFATEKVLEGLSPEQPRLLPEKPAAAFNPERPEQGVQRKFTRVKGGKDFYCGASFEGPILCWGKRKETIDGKFIDLAIGGDELCWIDSANQLSCDKTKTPDGLFSRVAASGQNFCALGTNGAVKCWGADSADPLPGLRAEFISVGDQFACAADITRKLVCWGKEMPFMLPIDPLRVRDIAAGAGFLCALGEDSEVQCFGKGPRLPDGRYTTLNAGFEQVCGITIAGTNQCAGTVSEPIVGHTRRFAIAQSSVCAHLMKNELLCKGSAQAGQQNIPFDPTKRKSKDAAKKSAPAVDGDTWIEFIELFPEQKPPHEFKFDSALDLGDRIPARFEPILGEDPNRYRAGIGFDFGAGVLGFSVFDLEERALKLFLFQNRKKVEGFALIKNERTQSEPVEAEDGTAQFEKKVTVRESIVTSDHTIEVIERSGTEVTRLVKKHIDGSRPVSSIDCQIQKSTWVSRVDDTGKSSRQHAKIKREYGAVDQNGCSGHAPF